jgi:hypothetical protein
MPFHVEISRGFRHARVFNLEREKLQSTVLDPWIRGARIQLGDQEWKPRASALRVLEGPELTSPDLSMGKGWDAAQRSGEDVTRSLLAEVSTPVVAVLAESPAAERAVREMLDRLEVKTVAWAAQRTRILAPSPTEDRPGFNAAVLVTDSADPPPTWLLDAGLALGALGGRAVIARLGEGDISPSLEGAAVVRLDAGDEGSVRALAERLGRPLEPA